MHGGLKSNAYFSGTKPLGGFAFLFLPFYFVGTGFFYYYLNKKMFTIALGMRSN